MQHSFRAPDRHNGRTPAPGAPADTVRWVRGSAEPVNGQDGAIGSPAVQGAAIPRPLWWPLRIPRGPPPAQPDGSLRAPERFT